MRDSDASRFLRYAPWLRARYGGPTHRIPVDAGFSCPVREAGRPCAYCDDAGSRPDFLVDGMSIEQQIGRGAEITAGRYGPSRHLLYFQAHSNTHGSVGRLRDTWDRGLEAARSVVGGSLAGLVIATRPDCVDEARADLLCEYASSGLDVWVELGLQSANDATLAAIDRGHDVACFDRAVDLLVDRGLHVAAHVILGLPGEASDAAIATARHLSALPVEGVKFHNLVVVEGTPLYERAVSGELVPPSQSAHVRLLADAIEHLRDDIVVMRLTCDPPHGRRHLPEELPDKASVYRDLEALLSQRGTEQGIYWRQHANEG